MKDESQIDEMRAAIRGDRERAEQSRQRSHENVRALIEPSLGDGSPGEPQAPVVLRRAGLRSFFKRR